VTSNQSTVGSYEYDENGNMTCRIESGVTYKQEYNTETCVELVETTEFHPSQNLTKALVPM
jgi:hypothetical protein